MQTLINLLNSQTKPFENAIVICYERLVLSFIFAPQDIPKVQSRAYQQEGLELEVSYALGLESFTKWLEHSAQYRRLMPAEEWEASKYLTTLETEIFKLFVKTEYHAPLQLRDQIMLNQFPCMPFVWASENGNINKFKTIKTFYKHLHSLYQTRAWKLSYLM